MSPTSAEFNDPMFSSLLSQTRVYLSSPDFAYALSAALDRATSVLVDGLRAKVFVDLNTTNVPEGLSANNPIDLTVGQEVKEEVKVRLAGLLPGLARWSQLALNAVPNELVDVSIFFRFSSPPPLSSSLIPPSFSIRALIAFGSQNIMAVRELGALEAIVMSDYQDRYSN